MFRVVAVAVRKVYLSSVGLVRTTVLNPKPRESGVWGAFESGSGAFWVAPLQPKPKC